MKTDVAIDKLIEIAPIIKSLRPAFCEDEEIKNFYNEKRTGKVNNIDFGLSMFPILLKKYKNEIYKIIGILNDKTAEEVAEQRFSVTLNNIKTLFNDEDFKDFFSSVLLKKAEE